MGVFFSARNSKNSHMERWGLPGILENYVQQPNLGARWIMNDSVIYPDPSPLAIAKRVLSVFQRLTSRIGSVFGGTSSLLLSFRLSPHLAKGRLERFLTVMNGPSGQVGIISSESSIDGENDKGSYF